MRDRVRATARVSDRAASATQINNMSAMEINAIRPLVLETLNTIASLRTAAPPQNDTAASHANPATTPDPGAYRRNLHTIR